MMFGDAIIGMNCNISFQFYCWTVSMVWCVGFYSETVDSISTGSGSGAGGSGSAAGGAGSGSMVARVVNCGCGCGCGCPNITFGPTFR